jgi:folate-binding protein YgfZ
MNAYTDRMPEVVISQLTQDGVIRVSGADARAFLHGQLTNDIEHLAPDYVRRAGWCTAKGRLLATMLVLRDSDDFLLLLASDIVSAVIKRLRMFVLRSKVTIDDESARWAHYGLIGRGADQVLAANNTAVPAMGVHSLIRADDAWVMRLEGGRLRLLLDRDSNALRVDRLALPLVDASRWTLEDIRAGVPQVVAATQDLFVPQMVNFEIIAGLDFKKGCYPGQEVVARAQYRGQVKRHLCRARIAGDSALAAGQALVCDDQPGEACGTIVATAPADGGSELLAVVPDAVREAQVTVRATPDGAPLEWLPLPDAA